jgi:hypothetical protein
MKLLPYINMLPILLFPTTLFLSVLLVIAASGRSKNRKNKIILEEDN